MAIRFVIGLYVLVVITVLFIAACGGGDGGAATETPAPPASNETGCREGLQIVDGPIHQTFTLGSVVGIVQSSGTEPGFDHLIVTAQVRQAAAGSVETEVVLVGDLITEVGVGDCVAFAGQHQRWACGPDCEDLGFVASLFEVIEAE